LQYVALFMGLELFSRRYARKPARLAVIHNETVAVAS
ncbi:hypothetical protein J2Z21_008364, partial [Streptomyces griseochromogenes]|nr:hypothetical protein [Streptomyces griseochromogenes]